MPNAGPSGTAPEKWIEIWDVRMEPGELDRVNALFEMDDADVRSQVGTNFFRCLLASPDVKNPFFPQAPAPEFPPADAAASQLVGQVAVGLICWAMSFTANYGFSRTVKREESKRLVQGIIAPNDACVCLSRAAYTHFFPRYCRTHGRAQDISFEEIQQSPDRARIASLFCQVAAGDAFFAKMMALKAAYPNAFPQRVHVLLAKAEEITGHLEPELKPVRDRWQPQLQGSPFTSYEPMQRDPQGRPFSEQTFMSEVQACTGHPTEIGKKVVGGRTQGGPGGVWHPIYATVYKFGIAVEDWLKDTRQKHGELLTGDSPTNLS